MTEHAKPPVAPVATPAGEHTPVMLPPDAIGLGVQTEPVAPELSSEVSQVGVTALPTDKLGVPSDVVAPDVEEVAGTKPTTGRLTDASTWLRLLKPRLKGEKKAA